MVAGVQVECSREDIFDCLWIVLDRAPIECRVECSALIGAQKGYTQ